MNVQLSDEYKGDRKSGTENPDGVHKNHQEKEG